MKLVRKADYKHRKSNVLSRIQSCLSTRRWPRIVKICTRGNGDTHGALVTANQRLPMMTMAKRRTTTGMANDIFQDKAVTVREDLQHFHKILPPRYLRKATRETFMYDGSFYQAVSSVLLMAQFFGLMPVCGVKSKGPSDLFFSWLSIRTIVTIFFIIITFFYTSLTLYMVLDQPISFNSLEPLIFQVSNCIICISFLRLAKQWPDLMLKWQAVEKVLPPYFTQVDKRQLGVKIKMVVFVAMMLSMVEHFLSVITGIHYANFCPITDDPIANFLILTNRNIFHTFQYSYGMAWFGKVVNFMLTFGWNYMDCFVMIISIGLASLFKQINDDLFKFKGMQMPEYYWTERRIQYRNLCVLCENIDNAISVITMVSFSNNLYFICIQLLKSLNKMPSFAHALYFYFSLFFLLGRTMAVSLYSADIHDESKKPLRCLRCVPKESWCNEVKRFSDEVSTDIVALSGMKFFHLTRKLVLSVAGTIVTYELVLIQFREENAVWDCERKDLE